MEKWQKYLKTVAVLTILWGAAQVIGAVTLYFGAFDSNVLTQTGVSFAAAFSSAIALSVSAAIEITAGVLGICAAKYSAKIKPAYIAGWVCLIYNAFNQLYNICVSMSPMNVAALFAALVLPILYMIFAYKVKQGE